jgi:hypothetical protein
MLISIVEPSRDRLEGLRRIIESIRETTQEFDVEIVAVLDKPDPKSHNLIASLQPGITVVTMPDSYVNGHPQLKFQAGYEASKGEWVVHGSDDITFADGWLAAALVYPNKGFIGLNDEHHGSNLAPLMMVTREYIETTMNGRFGLPWYYVWWADNEWKVKAMRANAFTVCPGARFNHHHAAYTGNYDSIALLGQSHHDYDAKAFAARHEAGFPEDWPEAP